jgi:hypothetical protein
MTPAGIEPETFRFVAQHLNHCATAVPPKDCMEIYLTSNLWIFKISHTKKITWTRTRVKNNVLHWYFDAVEDNSETEISETSREQEV